MITKDEKLKLANLGGGLALRLFDQELTKVLRNILDSNMPATKTREINIKVSIRSDETRDMIDLNVGATSKLAAPMPITIKALFGQDADGRIEAREFETGQQSLFPSKPKIVPLKKEGGEKHD
jgi:hypothetical protein